MGDFGIVVVPRDGTDTERTMNHSSVLRKHKVKTGLTVNHVAVFASAMP